MPDSRLLQAIVLLCCSFFATTASVAEDPVTSNVETHEIFSAVPSNGVFHGLEVKGSIDDEKRWVSLKGPQFYSAPTKTVEGILPSYLTWYEIRKPKPEPPRTVTIKDSYSGNDSFSVTLGAPAFFAMPAQTLGDGAPAQIPESLDLFIAFKINNVDSVELPNPTPGKPLYVCVPAEEWHHADHFAIKKPENFLMVYELEASDPKTADAETRTAIIDQFGLNPLAIKSKGMLYVPAKPVR